MPTCLALVRYGYKLDTELALEGDGKYRRHLKFRTLDEVNQSKAKIKLLLLQIEKIDAEQL